MRLQRPNACGYSGWTCVGVGQLSDVYRRTRMVSDDVFARTSDFEPDWDDPAYSGVPESARWNWIDNYHNIPTALAGMQTTVDRLVDMSGGVSGVPTVIPEVDCLNDTDAFTQAGFVDAFGSYESAGTAICATVTYTVRDGASTSTVEQVIPVASSNICFEDCVVPLPSPSQVPTPVLRGGAKGGGATKEPTRDEPSGTGTGTAGGAASLSIGTMEPMMDIDFSPVGVDLSTSIDTYINGVWDELGRMWQLMIRAANATCDQFRIEYDGSDASDLPFDSSDKFMSNPRYGGIGNKYTCSGGTVKINGRNVSIAAYSGHFGVGTHIYANLTLSSPDSSTGEYMSCTGELSTSPGGDYYFGIGYVYEAVVGDPSGSGPWYKMGVIVQENCSISARIVKTSKGGLLYLPDGVRYQIKEIAPCEDDE